MTDPVQTMRCAECGEPTPVKELDADDRCAVCASLMSLKYTLTKLGRIRAELPLERKPE